MATVLYPSQCLLVERSGRSVMLRRVAAALLAAALFVLAGLAAGPARGDIGELGAPPSESEVLRTLTDLFNAGQPSGSTAVVRLDGPVLVGPPTDHPNPPPRPWCVRCGYPDQGSSPMYPVMATVRVAVNQGLESSALAPGSTAQWETAHNGTSCAGVTLLSQYCPAYYFYRDALGNWHVA